MEAAHLPALYAVLAAAILSPGPARLVALPTTLTDGPVAGFATGAGLAIVAAQWTDLVLFWSNRAFTLVSRACLGLRLAAAACLVQIGLRIVAGATVPLPVHGAARRGARRPVLRGTAINLANPKSVVFAASVLIVVLPPDLSPAATALGVADHLGVELTFCAALAALLSRLAARAAYLRATAILDRMADAVMAAPGLRLPVAPR